LAETVVRESTEIVKILVTAEPRGRCYVFTISMAVASGHAEITGILEAAGTRNDRRRDPVVDAVTAKSLDTVKSLVAAEV
jgi:hypothetical protein